LTMQTIRPAPQELSDGVLSPERLQFAGTQLQRDGCLLLEGIFPVDAIEIWRKAFLDRYQSYLEDKKHGDALKVGDRRFMITIRLEPPFDDPNLYGNSILLQVLRKALSNECVLGSFGCVASLPGAEDQHVHRDSPALFGEGLIESMLPSYATTAILPLIDMNEKTGVTRVWSRSHRMRDPEQQLPWTDPQAAIGSALLMDYRLMHQGTRNRSDQVRPIIYLVYNRPWYRDPVNFACQPPLSISRASYERLPQSTRTLFAGAQIVEKRDNQISIIRSERC
jgi:hypothetical protein